MKTISLIAVLLVVVVAAAWAGQGADLKPTRVLKQRIAEVERSSQLILVIAGDWNAIQGKLYTFERNDNDWRAASFNSEVALGKKGMAWGIGLHGDRGRDGPCKKEGDDRAPAGVFELDEVFGVAELSRALPLHFPYRHITETIEAIDDPRSRYYNRLVDARTVKTKDWSSSERMLRSDDLYQWGIVVRHNWQQSPGDGSCIFLHTWMRRRQGTSGCTAMPASVLQKLIHWIDQTKRPLLVQLPKAEYDLLASGWRLPEVSMTAR